MPAAKDNVVLGAEPDIASHGWRLHLSLLTGKRRVDRDERALNQFGAAERDLGGISHPGQDV